MNRQVRVVCPSCLNPVSLIVENVEDMPGPMMWAIGDMYCGACIAALTVARANEED